MTILYKAESIWGAEPLPRFAPLRYKTLHLDGWRWRQGFAIDLPGHPGLRFCCYRTDGRWLVDNFDTGMAYSMGKNERSRRATAAQLLAEVPALLAGGRYTKKVKAAAGLIRRARQMGEIKR